MPGRRITDHQKKMFWNLVTEIGMSPYLAGQQVGISPSSVSRLLTGSKRGLITDARKAQRDLPDPRPLAELDGGVRDLLKPSGFNDFCEVFYCRIPSTARYDAAQRIIEAILEPGRVFLDFNLFPGFGKSTIMQDVKVWLIAGGGFEDPARGRAIRIMQGSSVLKKSVHEVMQVQRMLELTRPFYDKIQHRKAELCLPLTFGRFKPDTQKGEESVWRQEQIIVAQVQELDIYDKEPTLQAASRESGFLGERCDLAIWDDIATTDNSTSAEVAMMLDQWFEDEAETRVEPNGALVLVGQRLGPLDLHRKRLDATFSKDGVNTPLYKHVIYPAHWDALCDGEHRQWNGVAPDEGEGEGCLTFEARMPWHDVERARSKVNFRTVYQQEDVDPESVLVQPIWLPGGIDSDGYPAPGCFDYDRGFYDWPKNAGKLIDYATCDPAAGNWWAVEWWATPVEVAEDSPRYRWMIYGERRRMAAGKFLDWDNERQEFTGIMHELTVASIIGGHPLRVWVVEQNAAHSYLFQFEHYRRWRQKFPLIHVITHETGRNKADPDRGVQGALQMPYKQGLKRLPRSSEDTRWLNYMAVKIRELTTYSTSAKNKQTTDTVMADWFGEMNLRRIVELGSRSLGEEMTKVDAKLPAYLEKQLVVQRYGTEGWQ